MRGPTTDARAGGEARRVAPARVIAWASWDWGSSGFNSVIVTFVFSVYLTDSVGDDLPGPLEAGTWYTISVAVAGLLIAALTPITGQRADSDGRHQRSLALFTGLVVICVLGLFWVRDDYHYFFLGTILMGLGSVFYEAASVFYNAMLREVSTPANVGRVSGFGWCMGYLGGIVLLLICYFGFVTSNGAASTGGLLGTRTDDGFNIRLVALVAAAWLAIFSFPLLSRRSEVPTRPQAARLGVLGSYRSLGNSVRQLIRRDRSTASFLLASAIFRDGLAGIFHFGAILAVLVYQLSPSDVLLFGVAANLVAAVGALVAGLLDDIYGPRSVIVVSLSGLLATGSTLLFVSGPRAFWTLGLILCLFVGPAQSSARTYLTRVARPGEVGRMFGLYAAAGRAVSFLSPGLYALGTVVFGDQRYGIIGILVVLASGLGILLRIPEPSCEVLSRPGPDSRV